jgi:UDP-N-acetylglucosamine 2-epimerase (non-hydrolysing)
MKKIRALLVFGTRPEAIKMAPVFRELAARPEDFETRVCVTAQHRGMLDQVLSIFGIRPDYDLDLMRPGQDLGALTCRVIEGVTDVMREVHPDVVLVHGDTTTSMASALAAFYLRIPIAHVEAGLRTRNIHSPWPEEANRQLTARLAAIHFAPTEGARVELLKDGIAPSAIGVTGNTVIDALNWMVARIEGDPGKRTKLERGVMEVTGLRDLSAPFVLVTGHRRENFGEAMTGIFGGLRKLAEAHPSVGIVYPVHPNPNVQHAVQLTLSGVQNVRLCDPVDYESFVLLMNRCAFIITDSGGIQEEAPSLGKPVLLTRDTTERPEAIEAGCVKMVGTDGNTLFEEANLLLTDPGVYSSMARAANPYGDGLASRRIADSLKRSILA